VSKNASAADDASPISAAETSALFDRLGAAPALLMAVSGGPDSTALMLLLARWRDSRAHSPKLVAVTVDHGLRAASKREAKAVAVLARKLGIEHRTMRWTGRKPKTGLQEAARAARYRLLSDAARKAGATHVLTAHTRDDQAETLLIRLARGSGVSGLAGMYPLSGLPVEAGQGLTLVRPLLQIAKARLIATLKAAKVRFATDPSNRDPRFTRSRWRGLMSALAREGLTPLRLAALASRVQRVEETLWEVAAAARAKVAPDPWPPGGPVTMQARAFADLPPEIALRLLGRAIAWTGDEGPVELGKLEALYAAMCELQTSAIERPEPSARFRRTLAGAVVTLAGEQLTVERAPPRAAKRRDQHNRLTKGPNGRRSTPKHR
jgi:tRNA(Ile)-lysidine synthase